MTRAVPQIDGPRNRGGRQLVTVGLVLVALAIFLTLAVRFPLNSDVAWFMTMARRMLEGDKLYRDVVDVNPPLIVYLMLPAVILSELTGLSDTLSLQLLIFFGAVFSVLGFMRLVGTRELGIRAAWWVVLLSFAILVVPAYDFGQREHLLVLFTLPYLAVKWRRLEGLIVPPLPAWAAGTVAGLGFAIKPHFVVIWLVLEAVDRIRRPKLRRFNADPESIGVAIVLALYAVLVVAIHPAYLSLIADIGPLYYGFSSASFRILFIAYFGVPLLFVLLAAVVAPRSFRERQLALVFLAFASAALLGAFLQGKGWRYHSLPSIMATVVAWGALGQGALRSMVRGRSRAERFKAAFVVGILLVAVYPFHHGFEYALRLAHQQRLSFEQRAEEVARFEPRRVLVLGDIVADGFPLINDIGARSVSPYPSMWWLRSLYSPDGGEPPLATVRERSASERRLYDLLIASFLEDPPDLVLVDTAASQRFEGGAFPYLEYLSQDSAFASAWRSYRHVGEVERFTVWRERGSLDDGQP